MQQATEKRCREATREEIEKIEHLRKFLKVIISTTEDRKVQATALVSLLIEIYVESGCEKEDYIHFIGNAWDFYTED